MEYLPGSLESSRDRLLQARNWVVAAFVSAVAAAVMKPEALRFLTDSSRTISDYLFVALLAVNVLVGLGWIWIPEREFQLLADWLDPDSYSPPDGTKEWALILGIGLLLGTQILSTRNPILYGVVFAGSSGWTLFSVLHVNRELEAAITASRTRLQKAIATPGNDEEEALDGKALDVLEEYFLKRHHITRYGVSIVFSLIGLALAIAAQSRSSEFLKSCSYCVFLSWFVVSETIIFRWRSTRDEEMRPLVAQRNEIRRTRKPGQ